jgi:sulfur relay protein TusB/DsrH
MKILHIIRNPYDATPIDIARAQSKEHEVALLLMHDAVFASPDLKVYACAADSEARGISKHEKVGYDRIVEMLFEYDKVISW